MFAVGSPRSLRPLLCALAVLLCCLSAAAIAPAESFTIPVRVRVEGRGGLLDRDVAKVVLTTPTQPEALVLEIRRSGLLLRRHDGARLRSVWQERVRFEPGVTTILLKQRPYGFAVCVNHRQVKLEPFLLRGEVKIEFHPDGGLSAVARPRMQRMEPIRFGDDFARSSDAGQGQELWQTVSGRFALNSSLNPGSSQGAFQFWGGTPDGEGLTVAENSYWFWDDYEAGVAVNCAELPACPGLVFHYIDPDNYHVLRWSQSLSEPGQIELVRRRNGMDSTLSSSTLTIRTHQWNRLAVATYGTLVKAFVNGIEVGQARDDALIGGRIGLYLDRSATVYFDDVTVQSSDHRVQGPDWTPADPFGPCEQRWSDYSAKRFSADQHMVHWAQPRSFWSDASGPDSSLSWFRTRIFRDVTFSWTSSEGPCAWPRQPIEVALLADREVPESGYRLRLDGHQARITRNGAELAQTRVDAQALDTLVVSVDNGDLRCSINGTEILRCHDPAPIPKGEVGARLAAFRNRDVRARDWRDAVRIESSHRLDYGFDSAPTAWEVGSGTWRGTHRWACVPRWSFFGGRGHPGRAGIRFGNAVLWNRRRFKGDFDLELFLAPMEGTPQRVHFSWPVTINAVFSSDGRNLDSGYTLLFGTYDLPSRLFREGREMAAWTDRVRPGLRLETRTLYHRLTQTWQHIRIQRCGTRIRIDVGKHDDQGRYLGLERAFEVEDPEPLTGDRIGLWTWGANGLAIARATISYDDSPGPAEDRGAAISRPPAANSDGVSVEELRGEKAGGKANFLRITNHASGGSFVYDLAAEPVDIEATGTLRFDYRPHAPMALSVFASVRGHAIEAVVQGAAPYRPTTIPLGRVAVDVPVDEGKWSHCGIDLLQALRARFPTGPLMADRVVLASPYDTIEQIAGLGINRYGACYDLTNVQWSPSPIADSAPGQRLEVLVNGVNPIDDFETGLGEWRRLGGWDGAAVYRDAYKPAAGSFSVRLLNQIVGGPAGAWITQTPYNLSAFPHFACDYRIPPGIEINLLVRANARWFEVRGSGTDASWPLVGTLPDFVTDGTWRQAEVDLYALLRKALRTDKITVEALAWADSKGMSSHQNTAYWMDNVRRPPAVDPQRNTPFTLVWGNREIRAYSYRIDSEPDTIPPEEPAGEGATLQLTGDLPGSFLHVRAKDAQGRWSDPRHIPLVSGTIVDTASSSESSEHRTPPGTAPPAPFVSPIPSDRLCRNAFEYERNPEFPEQHLGEFQIRREAWILPVHGDAATGTGCVELLNLDQSGFYSAYFRRSAWDLERWPYVAFDYKFEQDDCALNLSLLVNDAMTIVEWTGRNQPGNYFDSSVVGNAGPAKQDGKWHRAEFNLLDMVLKARFPHSNSHGKLIAAELSTWATNHLGSRRPLYSNPLGARIKIDNVTIFSPKGRSPAFEWRVHEFTAPMQGYAYTFDQEPDTVPPETIMTAATRLEFDNVTPGIWYLHVRACSEDGFWGNTGRARITVAE